ncbi:hypothetical protein EZV62_018957 [Acer yangbiense]|uniref:Wall-associated receptor kinase galacturonan-binding domain-containing protein n=1 Tax=Acer yangbiense TaxID=1000413 RepID=A0A5C7H9W9_9ROSI|nr:hypothetical protein EZV62_018957 [Acer yangbiense]
MIPPLLFQLMILLSWPINALAESPVIAKPGCPTSCGNGTVSIPFPFGIGDGCYLDYWYEVTCNSSGPFLKSINLEVLNISISLEASTMLVNQPVFQYCDLSPYGFVRNETVNLESSPFFFSDANRFTGVGCNNFAYLSSNRSIISGCISFCNKKDKSEKKSNVNFSNSGCNGIQCCQTRIPSSPMLQQLNVTLTTVSDKEEKQVQNKCRSAFLVDQEWLGNNMFLFNTETSDSPIKALGLKHVPVLLDWGIDESSFDRIDSNSSQEYNGTSGCKVFVNISTSTIDYFTNETSYNTSSVRQCSCRRGYEGNPYLLQGCNGKLLPLEILMNASLRYELHKWKLRLPPPGYRPSTHKLGRSYVRHRHRLWRIVSAYWGLIAFVLFRADGSK